MEDDDAEGTGSCEDEAVVLASVWLSCDISFKCCCDDVQVESEDGWESNSGDFSLATAFDAEVVCAATTSCDGIAVCVVAVVGTVTAVGSGPLINDAVVGAVTVERTLVDDAVVGTVTAVGSGTLIGDAVVAAKTVVGGAQADVVVVVVSSGNEGAVV